LLHLPRSSIEIVTGEESRQKLIRIRDGQEVARQLNSSLSVPRRPEPGAVPIEIIDCGPLRTREGEARPGID
jgi:hypothetical protein